MRPTTVDNSHGPAIPSRWAFGHLNATGEDSLGAALLHARGYVDDGEIFYCPSVRPEAGINYQRHWNPRGSQGFADGSHTFIGYQYFAGYQVHPSVVLDHSRMAGATVAANRGNILAMDLTCGDQTWWRSNHQDSAGLPIGFNRLYTDQTVQWIEFGDHGDEWFHSLNTFYY